MKVLDAGAWKDATPRGVLDGGVWKEPKTVYVLSGGVWTQVWPGDSPPVEEPPYLYAVEVEYLPNYVVNFTAKKGLPYDPDSDEAFMFRCVQMPKDGYTGREFTKQWSVNGYGGLDCTLQDLWGDGVPANNAEMMKTVSFQIHPRP
jgi:hypothetical protein